MKITVISGKEGDRTTYVGKMTYGQIAEVMSILDPNVPTDEKLQRDLVASRTNNIATYLLTNTDFLFPGVVAIVENSNYEQANGFPDPNVGFVNLLPGEFRYLCDGQGRLSGIQKVLGERPDMADNTIDVKFVDSRGASTDKQVFADINKTPIKPSGSINIAFDSRQVLNQMAKAMLESNPGIKQLVCYEKTSVSTKTDKLWTLNQMAGFIVKVTGLSAKACQKQLESEADRDKMLRFLNEFWLELGNRFDLLGQVLRNEITPQHLKETTVVGTAVWLDSVGVYAKVVLAGFIFANQKRWSDLDGLNNIDYKKSNKEWMGRCIDMRGKFTKNTDAVNATASHLLLRCGLTLPKELDQAEALVEVGRRNLGSLESEPATLQGVA